MNKKEKEKRDRLRKQKYDAEKKQIEEFRKNGALLKPSLRKVGCDLPFYDYLDSYTEEFERVVAAGRSAFPSLMGVHEVDDDDYYPCNGSKTLAFRRNLQVVI